MNIEFVILATILSLLVRSLCCPALQLLEYVISKMENLRSRVVNQDHFQEMFVYSMGNSDCVHKQIMSGGGCKY